MRNGEGNDEENEETSKKQFEKMGKQFKGLDSSNISPLSTGTLGIVGKMTQLQNNLNKPFKDIDRTSPFMTQALGVSAMTTTFERLGSQFKDIGGISALSTRALGMAMATPFERLNKQFRDIGGVSALSKQALGVSAMMTTLEKLNKPFKDIGRTSAFMTQALGASAMMKPYQSNWGKQFKDINFSNMKINENGTIEYLNETILPIETMDEINLYINSDISWEEKTDKILQEVKSKHPIIVFLIITFVFYPFYAYYVDYVKGGISTSIQQIQSKSKMYSDKNKIAKDIKKEVIKELYINSSQDTNVKMALNQYRFVKADCLNIRISNSTNSKVIYNLKFGQSVRVLNKDKNWTLIEYTDDENICVKGWVFTRYLSTFN